MRFDNQHRRWPFTGDVKQGIGNGQMVLITLMTSSSPQAKDDRVYHGKQWTDITPEVERPHFAGLSLGHLSRQWSWVWTHLSTCWSCYKLGWMMFDEIFSEAFIGCCCLLRLHTPRCIPYISRSP